MWHTGKRIAFYTSHEVNRVLNSPVHGQLNRRWNATNLWLAYALRFEEIK